MWIQQFSTVVMSYYWGLSHTGPSQQGIINYKHKIATGEL